MKFELSEKELKSYKVFKAECDPLILKKQKENSLCLSTEEQEIMKESTRNWTRPYGGAIGQFYCFEFYPNNIGHCVVVRCDYLNLQKDITDIECW